MSEATDRPDRAKTADFEADFYIKTAKSIDGKKAQLGGRAFFESVYCNTYRYYK